MRKPEHVATLTIWEPGKMTPEGRKDIADWMRKQADFLEAEGQDYSNHKFTARFNVARKED